MPKDGSHNGPGIWPDCGAFDSQSLYSKQLQTQARDDAVSREVCHVLQPDAVHARKLMSWGLPISVTHGMRMRKRVTPIGGINSI